MVTRLERRAFYETVFNDDSSLHRVRAGEVANRDGRAVMIAELLWPALGQIDQLRRSDAISEFSGRSAIRRISSLARRGSTCSDKYFRGRLTAMVISGTASEDEAMADVAGSMLEGTGVVTRICGGGVPESQILGDLRDRPVDLLFIASIGPSEAPAIRHLMDRVRELPAAIRPRILAGGGLFARAEGLALEMGADLELNDPRRLFEAFGESPKPTLDGGLDAIESYAA